MNKVLKEIISYVLIIVAVVLIRTFIVTPVRVEGPSMEDTTYDGEILILKKYDKSIERFDIVVFDYSGEKLIKRVIGVPGDSIKVISGNLYINNDLIEEDYLGSSTEDFNYNNIEEGTYFVMGDNREQSYDSRNIGPINKEDINGVIGVRLYPFNKIGSLDE